VGVTLTPDGRFGCKPHSVTLGCDLKSLMAESVINNTKRHLSFQETALGQNLTFFFGKSAG